MAVKDKATGEIVKRSVRLDHDEGNRPETTIEDLRSLKPVVEVGIVTAGNASQLSDGASACVVMEATPAERRGLAPLGRYVGMTMAGTKPDEMGIGPVFAVAGLLKPFDRTMDGIGWWELNGGFLSPRAYHRVHPPISKN